MLPLNIQNKTVPDISNGIILSHIGEINLGTNDDADCVNWSCAT